MHKYLLISFTEQLTIHLVGGIKFNPTEVVQPHAKTNASENGSCSKVILQGCYM